MQQTQPTNLFGQQQPANLFGQQPFTQPTNQPQPFAQMANQPQPFAQPTNQPQPFAQMANQPQPFAQPAYQQQPQQQPSPFQPMTQNPPTFQPATNSPFSSQPSIYNPAPAQPFPTNFPVFQQQAPAAGVPSPFAISQTQQPAAQQPAAVQQQSPFVSDPFATNGFHTPSQPSVQPPAQPTNPFAATGDQSFGILQPKPVPQPAAAPAAHANNPAPNLFSDLNPLPTDTSSLRKDQFFSEVKNPPKPKLNEIPMTKTTPPEDTVNNSNDLFSTSPVELLSLSLPDNDTPLTSQHLIPPLCTPDASTSTSGSAPAPIDNQTVTTSINQQHSSETSDDLFSELFSLAPNNSSQIPGALPHDSANLAWLNQQEAGQQPAAANANDLVAKQSLISPPPRNLRQRQGMQGAAQVFRPR